MAGVGETLQRARHERKLTLEQAEEATRIRARYLAALEADRFDALPAPAYARAFARDYALFLGLDPGPLLEQLGDDVEGSAPGDRAPAMLVPQRPGGLLGRYGLGLAIAVLIVGIMAWTLSRNGHNAPSPAALTSTTRSAPVVTPRPRKPVRPRPLPPPRLTVAASKGDCWLSVHLGSAAGATLWEGTLTVGRKLHFARRALWIRIGAPGSLDLRLNGRPLSLPPPQGGTLNVLVTRGGARAA